MTPSQLGQFLVRAITAKLPVLITGAPGIGKSDIVAQAALATGADVILSHPAVSDPTDAKGLPWIAKDGDTATFLPFGELARAIKATRPTIWFLDDLGQAAPATQASYMQLLLARCVNGHALPDCVTFIAATNRRTDRAGVSGILEPVKSRFATIVELEPSLDDWCTWAFAAGVPAELIAFLRFRSELLCKFTPSADLTNCPLPRTWSHVAKLLALQLPESLQHAAICGAVGEGAAVELSGFLQLYRELPIIDDLLNNPDSGVIPPKPASLYAVVTALGMKTTPKNFPKVARYAERLTEAHHGEFAALLLRDAVRRDGSIMQTAAFVKLASGELGQLIAGGSK
jgi:AAA domain (dynein-related subfamily)